MKRINLLPVKIIYILMQGLFLPLVLKADDFGDSGLNGLMWLTYGVYTLLVLADAVIGILIFGRR